MSRVTSERCRLTPDDTTITRSTTLSPPVIINMLRDGARQRDMEEEEMQTSE